MKSRKNIRKRKSNTNGQKIKKRLQSLGILFKGTGFNQYLSNKNMFPHMILLKLLIEDRTDALKKMALEIRAVLVYQNGQKK